MIRDKGNKYSLGFGISPSDVPHEPDPEEDEGSSPESGFIARSLHEHPIMRFFAVSAAALVGMHVASKVTQGVGSKFLGSLERQTVPLIDREWQTNLVQDFRALQSTLDQWEGAVRHIDPKTGGQVVDRSRVGFWASQEAKERAAKAGRPLESAEEWLWRDEIQKTLVRQARRLPYELPALYATQRLVTDKAVGGDTKKVNWHSPTDVISDFATQSVKNVATLLAPWEAGQSTLGHGWRKLMTYGDFTSGTSAFAPYLKGTSNSLRASLGLIGHDASDILYKGIQKSHKFSGAFTTAINQYVGTNRSLESKLNIEPFKSSTRGGAAGFFENTKYTAEGYARSLFSHAKTAGRELKRDDLDYLKKFDPQKTFARFFPKLNAFGHGFNEGWVGGEIRRPGRTQTELEQFAESIFRQSGGVAPGSREYLQNPELQRAFRGSPFFRDRSKELYKGILREELEAGPAAEQAAKFADQATILAPPYGSTDDISQRLYFGEHPSDLVASGQSSPWHDELQGNLRALFDEEGARNVTENLSQAVARSDERFLSLRAPEVDGELSPLEERIGNLWNTAYKGEIVPHIRGVMGEAPLPYEMFDYGMTDEARELLVRKAAQASGIPILSEGGGPVGVRGLIEQLKGRGFNVEDQYGLRNYLVDKGIISPPWTKQGFNALGLRPLTADEALEQKYIRPELVDPVKRVLSDVSQGDPYIGSMLRRPVGKGVFINESGEIIDLSSIYGIGRRALNAFHRNVQLPFLHFNPLSIGFYNPARQMSEMEPLVFSGGAQYFGEETVKNPTVAMRLKRGLFAPTVRVAEYGPEGTREVIDKARVWRTDRYSMLGRTARLGLGDKGQYAPEMDEGRLGWLKRKASWSPDQPQSLFRLLGRIGRSRRGDLMNVANYAKMVKEGDFPAELEPSQVGGYRPLEKFLRRYGTPYQVAREFEQIPELQDAFLGFDEAGERTSLAKIHNPDEMLKAIDSTLEHHRLELLHEKDKPENWGDPKFAQQESRIRHAQSILKRRYLDYRTVEDYFDASAPQAMRSTGIHRRLDELRADFYKYLAARQSILAKPMSVGQPSAIIDSLLPHLDELKAKRLISNSEYTEAKAAALSMQLNYLNLASYNREVTRPERIRNVLSGLHKSPLAQSGLGDIARYETQTAHKVGPWKPISQFFRQQLGAAEYDFPGVQYNPFGGNANYQFVPTVGSVFKRNPFGALKSVTGFNTWSDPQSFSGASLPVSHFYQRLNRYFSTFGWGAEETAFKGPQGFFNKGLVGKRVLPAMIAGTSFMALDRTLGGHLTPRDDQGDRVYRPAITGAIATGLAHARVGLAHVPGGKTPEEVRQEYFGYRDIPIRRGRYWPLSNTPFKGGRIMHYRPNWYRTFMSGYQYTGQDWDSPLEKLKYGYDYSPGRLLDPYHYERKHYEDRPFPVTGEYFTGPWGPLTSVLNMSAGRILKPHALMHKRELAAGLANYQGYGQYGMGYSQPSNLNPIVAARNPTGSLGVFQPRPATEILGLSGPSGSVTPERNPGAYKQPYGFMGVPYGTERSTAISSYLQPRPMVVGGDYNYSGSAEATGIADVNRYYESLADTPAPRKGLGIAGATAAGVSGGNGSRAGRRRLGHLGGFGGTENGGPYSTNPSNEVARSNLAAVNQYYSSLANQPKPRSYNPYNRVVMSKTQGFDPRLIPSANPITQGSMQFQGSQLGYELQELFGIYGFGFGTARKALGFGGYDYTPKRPVLQSAGRAYGTERAFWDLNIGGLGDFPNLSEGEYGNLELSEIVRRFIPHRRRDVNEVNPIPNKMGQQYPWLPGPDYFTNFKTGDPYIAIPMGELRLPGKGYERTHVLHPDRTGRYGLLDQHKILGEAAPWSQQYRALDQIIKKVPLSEEDKKFARITRKHVSAMNKRHTFSPYRYAHSQFENQKAKVTSIDPSDAEVLHTSFGTVRLAGVRARSGQAAQDFVRSLVKPGDEINLTYDANRPPPNRDAPVDVLAHRKGKNLNKILLNNPDYAFQAKTSAPIDQRVTHNKLSIFLHSQWEMFSHRNTIFHSKFMPNRTAVEDWERFHIYGSDFPQWSHPYRDFLKPLSYRAKNRNPLIAAGVLAAAGGLFGGSNPRARAIGRIVGGGLGFGLAVFSGAKSLETGQRFIPKDRRKEAAIDEYTDTLNYIKYKRLYNESRSKAAAKEHSDPEDIAQKIENGKYKRFQFANLGPETSSALIYRRRLKQTLYGADVFGDVMDLANAIPKRKRDHFLEFLNAPVNERQRILSTAPRLERRIYEARWGMKVERRPDLNQYFTDHELPSEKWEGWNPNVNMENVKLKIMRHQGLDVSQSGYYPQQMQETDLLNPSYPDFDQHSNHHSVQAKLRQLMRSQNINGDVVAVPSAFPGIRVQMQAGVA